MGPGSDGPMGGMGGMEPHHMNGSLGEHPCIRCPTPCPCCMGMPAEHPSACLWFGPVLEAEPLAGRGVWRGAGQGEVGAIASCSIRLFSFCVPWCRVRRHRWTSKSKWHWDGSVTLMDGGTLGGADWGRWNSVLPSWCFEG